MTHTEEERKKDTINKEKDQRGYLLRNSSFIFSFQPLIFLYWSSKDNELAGELDLVNSTVVKNKKLIVKILELKYIIFTNKIITLKKERRKKEK